MLFQKRDAGLVFRLWAEIEIAESRGCRSLLGFTSCPPRPTWPFASHFAVVAFLAMIFIQGTHGLSKNLCADARSLAGDERSVKGNGLLFFGLTLRPYLLAGGMRGVDGSIQGDALGSGLSFEGGRKSNGNRLR